MNTTTNHGGTTGGKAVETFSHALTAVKTGSKIYRKGWNGAGQFVELQTVQKGSKMTLPYLFITTVGGDLVPYVANNTDILANDWFVI